MADFSIRLARRNSMGDIMPGKYVEFETDSATELADFYEKTVVAVKPNKRHARVLANKHQRRGKNDARLSNGGAGE